MLYQEAFGTKTEGSNDKGIERLGDDAKPTGTFGMKEPVLKTLLPNSKILNS